MRPNSKKYGSVIYYDLNYAAKMINAIIYDDVTAEEFIKENDGFDKSKAELFIKTMFTNK